MIMRIGLRTTTIVATASLLSAPALAHHGMDLQLPRTLLDGLISGLAHPVIGLDHLLFVLAAGLLAARFERGAMLPVAFACAGLAGAALHVRGVGLPGGELGVALSLVVVGVVLAAGLAMSRPAAATLFAIAGFLHGHALAEAIVGAEPTPLAAYLAGFALVQAAIGVAVCLAARRAMAMASDATVLGGRIAGAVVAAAGLGFATLALA